MYWSTVVPGRQPAQASWTLWIMNIAHAILVLRAPCMRYRVCVLLVLSYRIQNATTVLWNTKIYKHSGTSTYVSYARSPLCVSLRSKYRYTGTCHTSRFFCSVESGTSATCWELRGLNHSPVQCLVCVDLLVPSSTCGEHKERDMRVLIMTEVVQVAQLLPVVLLEYVQAIPNHQHNTGIVYWTLSLFVEKFEVVRCVKCSIQATSVSNSFFCFAL